MLEDLPLQRVQPLYNIETPCAPCTSSEVDLESTCPLDMDSQAAGGEASEDYAELGDLSKHNCASGSVLQQKSATGDCVCQDDSTRLSDTLSNIKVPVTTKRCGRRSKRPHGYCYWAAKETQEGTH